jgi:predicted dehydrogenase
MNRRHFLLAASAATQSWAAANDRVRLAIIGVGSRGSAHIAEILPVANVEIAAVVDVDGRRTEAAAAAVFQKTGKRPKIETDMRRVFDDKEIDAVTIATTNHWHALTAIWAMQAGKDAYVEKPVSHNIWEGTKLVEAARKYNRIAAGGTQRRWWGRFRKAERASRLAQLGLVGRTGADAAVS